MAVLAIAFCFIVLTALAFAPLGQKLGFLIKKHAPLAGCSICVAGAMAGAAAFSAMGALSLRPEWWFIAGMAPALYFSRKPAVALAVALALTIGIPALFFIKSEKANWSTYQKITLTQMRDYTLDGYERLVGYELYANKDFQEFGLDLSDKSMDQFPKLNMFRKFYDAPYAAARPKEVLIIGDGMGNAAAAALRFGAQRVDVVEIDPVIAEYGRRLHPEKPFEDVRVHIYNADPRSFFMRAVIKYDLIAFYMPDSKAVSSSKSSLRKENYVYTLEIFQEAARLLNKDGAVSVSFLFERPWMMRRASLTLEKVFGHSPEKLGGGIFIAGNNGFGEEGGAGVEKRRAGVALPVDNWPYFYAEKKGIPVAYRAVLLLVLALLPALIRFSAPGAAKRLNGQFLFLGAAFMLIAARSFSLSALLLGAAWSANLLSITSALLMILLAILTAHFVENIPKSAAYAALIGCLLAFYFIPAEIYFGMNFAARTALLPLIFGAPMFFAGIVFAILFRDSSDLKSTLGSIITGAALGCLLEYSALFFGLRSLCLTALILLLISAIPIFNKHEAAP